MRPPNTASVTRVRGGEGSGCECDERATRGADGRRSQAGHTRRVTGQRGRMRRGAPGLRKWAWCQGCRRGAANPLPPVSAGHDAGNARSAPRGSGPAAPRVAPPIPPPSPASSPRTPVLRSRPCLHEARGVPPQGNHVKHRGRGEVAQQLLRVRNAGSTQLRRNRWVDPAELVLSLRVH